MMKTFAILFSIAAFLFLGYMIILFIKGLKIQIRRLNAMIDESEQLRMSKLLNYLRKNPDLLKSSKSNIQILKEYDE